MASEPQRLSMIRSYTAADLLTLGNASCGTISIFLCLGYIAEDRSTEIRAAFILPIVALLLDVLDGYVARLDPRRRSHLGADLDSLADIVSFGVAPAILAFAWGLRPLGRIGWAVGFLFVAAAAVRLARFNIQSASQDKRYFVGLPSPAAAAVPASTVFAYPAGFDSTAHALPILAVVVVPALLMVSTIRFRSFKTFDLQSRRSYPVLLLLALGIALVAAQPEYTLIALAYTYLASGLVGLTWARLRRRPDEHRDDAGPRPDGTKAV